MFEEVKKGKWTQNRRSFNRITVTNHNGKSLRISISGDLYEALGSPTNVKILVGTGNDTGKLRLIPSGEEGYKIAHKNARIATIGIYPKQIGIPAMKFPTTEVNFMMGTDFIEIILPKIKIVKEK